MRYFYILALVLQLSFVFDANAITCRVCASDNVNVGLPWSKCSADPASVDCNTFTIPLEAKQLFERGFNATKQISQMKTAQTGFPKALPKHVCAKLVIEGEEKFEIKSCLPTQQLEGNPLISPDFCMKAEIKDNAGMDFDGKLHACICDENDCNSGVGALMSSTSIMFLLVVALKSIR